MYSTEDDSRWKERKKLVNLQIVRLWGFGKVYGHRGFYNTVGTNEVVS